MKYSYKFKEILLKDGTKHLIIDVEEKTDLVSTFLNCEVECDGEYEKDILDKVLNGQSEYEEFYGNICGLEITKDITTIFNTLDDAKIDNLCQIETSELRQFIDIWLEELKEFSKREKELETKKLDDNDLKNDNNQIVNMYYNTINELVSQNYIDSNCKFSMPLYIKFKGELYHILFSYNQVSMDINSKIISKANRFIFMNDANTNVKLYKNIPNNDFINREIYIEDTIELKNTNEIGEDEVNRYLKIYGKLNNIVFKPKSELDEEDIKLIDEYTNIFYQTIPEELRMYYYLLSPAFLNWLGITPKLQSKLNRVNTSENTNENLEKFELIVQPLNKIEERLDYIANTFDESIKYDQYKEKLFNNMHKELTDYKNGMIDKIINNISMDIIKLIDSTTKTTEYFKEKEFNEENYRRLIRQFNGVIEDLQDILYRQSIEPYSVYDDVVNVNKQKIIKTIETTDITLDKKVAERLASGYEKDGKVIRPERINVYKYVNKEGEIN